MKKNIKLSIGYLVIISLFASCDVMDTKPFESYDEELVWNSPETADAFVMKTYNYTIANFSGGSASYESLTPNGALCDQVENKINTVATETGIDASSSGYGKGRYAEQRKCNMIIEKAAQSSGLSDGKKKELIAEGHFLRGALFFDMARKTGRFVPILKVLSVDDKEEFKAGYTTSVAQSYEYVMADLDKAVLDLPESSAAGRANKYAALALRSRAALQAYAYTKDAKYLDIAINSAQAVISSGKYTLTSNYGDMFDENSPNDAEIILARYYLDKDAQVSWFEEMIRVMPNLSSSETARGSKDGVPTLNPDIQTFSCWGYYWPTQDLVDQYLSIDEATGEAKPWYETSQYLDNVEPIDVNSIQKGSLEVFNRHDGEIRNLPTAQDLITGRTDYPLFARAGRVKATSTKDISDIMYKNRDKRFDYTVAHDKSQIWGETMEMNLGGNSSQGIRSKENGGWYTTTTGYYWRKNTVTPDPNSFYNVKINMHYVIARLGEMYMNLAEAYLLKRDIPKAVEALNRTRTTHGGLPASMAATEADAWKDYIRERRVEMAYESGDVFYSYLRWGKYGGYANDGRAEGDVIKALNAPVYKVGITSDRKSYCASQLTLLNSWSRKFTTKRYLYPIAQSEIDIRTADGLEHIQNEGW